MAFRLVSSGGSVTDPAMINMFASGTVHPGEVVEFSRTGGTGVYPGSMSSTVTNVFGVCMDYAQGASDKQVRVIPFTSGQIWEADCENSAITAQIGLRASLGYVRGNLNVYNISTDATTSTAIFRIVAINTSAGGSGKILGYFRRGDNAGAAEQYATSEAKAF